LPQSAALCNKEIPDLEINIERAKKEDLIDVATLFNSYRMFYKQNNNLEGAYKYISERLANGDSIIYIARDSEGLGMGFTQLYPTFSSQSMQRMWILNDLYVQESYRKIGVASSLLDKAKEHSLSSEAKGLMLCTQHTNHSAQALYKKHGFEPIGEFQWYFLKT
jgi:ribosomal protein S18 acetylase RimI-like enzyme